MKKIILTSENLHRVGTNGCGFNRDQLALLGIKWPPRNGWLKDLIGREIDEEKFSEIEALKGRRKRKNTPSVVMEELPLFNSDKPICTKCGVNRVYAQGGTHIEWCEPCVWEFVKE
jgi:hypothetical protein